MDRPVFVIGTGRSGLTPLMDLIAYHRDFAWLSQYNTRFPESYGISRLSRLVELPLLNSSRLKYWKHIPRHAEAYAFWSERYPGFVRPFRDLVADDVTPLVIGNIRRAVGEVTRLTGKTRFIAEYSGWSRIEFLNAIFPDAQFIHIVRDGRAVANSLTNTPYWQGWRGVHQWRWGVPEADLLAQLEKYGFSFLGLAAVQWKMLVNNILDKSATLPDERVLLVRYEDMVREPHETAFSCLDFLNLDKDSRHYRRHLSTVAIVNANTKSFRIPPWRENVSKPQVEMLNDLLADELLQLGYR